MQETIRNERNHERTERLAYQFWLERGCPFGSPEVDWLRAEEKLRSETFPPLSAFALGPETSL